MRTGGLDANPNPEWLTVI